MALSVAVGGGSPQENRELERALAILVALVPGQIIKRIAAQVEEVRELHTHGGVDVKLNTYDGRVESADFSMRSRWRIPNSQRNTASQS